MNGKLEMAQWFSHRIKTFSYTVMSEIFNFTIRGGFLEVAKWMKDVYPDVTIEKVSYSYSYRENWANIVKWLLEEFPPVSLEIRQKIFTQIVILNDLEMARWLKQTYPDITHQDANSNRSYDHAFCAACYYNCLEMAQWLIEVFPDIDPHKNKHLKLAQWLIETFPDIDHRALDDAAFRSINGTVYHVINGKSIFDEDKDKMQKWMMKKWRLYSLGQFSYIFAHK